MNESPSTETSSLDPFFKRIDLSNKSIDPNSLHCQQCGLPLGKKMADCPQRPSGHCPYLFAQTRFYTWPFALLFLVGAFALWVEGTQHHNVWEQLFFYSVSIICLLIAGYNRLHKQIRFRHKRTGETWSQSIPIERGTILYMPGNSVQRLMVVPPNVDLPELSYPVSVVCMLQPRYRELLQAEQAGSIKLVADTIATVLLWLVSQRVIDISYWPTYHKRHFGKLLEPDLTTTLHITFTESGRDAVVNGRLENKILEELDDFLPQADFSGVNAYKSVSPSVLANSLGISRSKYKREKRNPGLYEHRKRESIQKLVWQDMMQMDLVSVDKEHRLDRSHQAYWEGQLVDEMVQAFHQANPKLVSQLFDEIRSSLT